MQNCICRILNIVDICHCNMGKGDANHRVPQILELGSQEAYQVTLPRAAPSYYESLPVLHNDLYHLLLEFVIGISCHRTYKKSGRNVCGFELSFAVLIYIFLMYTRLNV